MYGLITIGSDNKKGIASENSFACLLLNLFLLKRNLSVCLSVCAGLMPDIYTSPYSLYPFNKSALPETLKKERNEILYHSPYDACQEKNDIW